MNYKVLSAAILALFPLTSFAQYQAQPILVGIFEGINASTKDQLLTVSVGEGAPAWSYTSLAPKFYLAPNAIPGAAGMHPLYRCKASGHFVSTSSNCEGNTNEGLYGYAFNESSPGLAPLQRMYSRSTGQHFVTTRPEEAIAADYSVESIIGYVFPSTVNQYPVPIPTHDYGMTPLYEGNTSGDQLITSTFGEGAPTYSYRSGVAFYILKDTSFGYGAPLKPLYRCNSGNGHFASNDGNCEGHITEGLYGYLFANQSMGTTTLYRFYSPSANKHVITVNPSVGGDYHVEGILGYTMPGYF